MFILRRMITKLFQVLSNTPIRGVHGSGRVRFVPNLDPTRIIRVEENVAQSQPGEVVGFFSLGLISFESRQVGIGFITGEEI